MFVLLTVRRVVTWTDCALVRQVGWGIIVLQVDDFHKHASTSVLNQNFQWKNSLFCYLCHFINNRWVISCNLMINFDLIRKIHYLIIQNVSSPMVKIVNLYVVNSVLTGRVTYTMEVARLIVRVEQVVYLVNIYFKWNDNSNVTAYIALCSFSIFLSDKHVASGEFQINTIKRSFF